MTQGRDILWTPSVGRYQASTMAAFERYLSKKHDLTFSDYNEMWRWSISDLNSFWGAIADFFELRFFEHPQKILNKKTTFIKTGIFSAIATCWGVILVGTFLTFK